MLTDFKVVLVGSIIYGKWYNSAGTAFNPGNLTLNTAQKWSAVKVVLGSMWTLGTNINGMTHCLLLELYPNQLVLHDLLLYFLGTST